ncbi:MAG: M28 family peptidase [Gemmatimonadota bacterium]
MVAEIPGTDAGAPRVVIAAHYDTVAGSPGADDNASGVAGVLECARLLAGRRPRATVELVAFDLEESQRTTYRVGSRHHAREARRAGVRYAGALVFEMIGYSDERPGSQRVPALIAWKRIPRVGNFLAVTGDGQSRRLLRTFREAARVAAPELPLVPLVTPLRGWLVWQTRLSDNASFWSEGYPALMVTDTAFLRNPHYHRPTDVAATLDYAFMASVVDATMETVVRLAGC